MICPLRTRKPDGFTLLELAIVLVVIGLLAGGGVALLGSIWEHQKRFETQAYMEEARQSLLVYASVSGRLPGALPSPPYSHLNYGALGIGANDAWNRPLRYEVHPGLLVNKTTSCSTVKSLIDGSALSTWSGPKVWDEDAAQALPVTVVLASAGAKDADNQDYDADPVAELRSAFDAIGGKGNNYSGTPFLFNRPGPEFDDLVVYIGPSTLYDWLKCP